MKNKKVFISAIILVAVLVLGIGYAGLTNNLSITGTLGAKPSDNNFVVKFLSDPAPTKDLTHVHANSTDAEVTPTVTNDNTANIVVSGLTTKDEYVTATYTIKNMSVDFDASLAAGSVTNDNAEYFKVELSFGKTTLVKGGEDTTTVTVKVTLLKTPLEDQSASITVPFTATAVAA